MSRFTQPIDIRHREGTDKDWIVVTRDLCWEVGSKGSGWEIHIPKGFVTDLASVPRFLWSFIPPHGRHTNASILHDYLYRKGHHMGRRWADRQFYEAMVALETPRFRARVMWLSVRVFGVRAWRSGGVLLLTRQG